MVEWVSEIGGPNTDEVSWYGWWGREFSELPGCPREKERKRKKGELPTLSKHAKATQPKTKTNQIKWYDTGEYINTVLVQK